MEQLQTQTFYAIDTLNLVLFSNMLFTHSVSQRIKGCIHKKNTSISPLLRMTYCSKMHCHWKFQWFLIKNLYHGSCDESLKNMMARKDIFSFAKSCNFIKLKVGTLQPLVIMHKIAMETFQKIGIVIKVTKTSLIQEIELR